ncbi:MAG: hypothetical protein WCV90_00465 [Candidatus Woesearchaeota archaeon]|jgi:hypothetical protein
MQLKRVLLESWKKVTEHKGLFLLVVLLQLGVILLMGYLLLTYPIKILENVQGIIAPLEQANYNATLIEAGIPFSTELLSVSQSYTLLQKNMSELFLALMGIFLVLQGWIWILSVRMVEGQKRKFGEEIYSFFSSWSKYVFFALVLNGISTLIGFLILTTWFDVNNLTISTWALAGVALVGVIGYYLQLVGFGLSAHPRKGLIGKWIKFSFKDIRQNIVVLGLNLIVLAGIIGLIYLTMLKESLFILTLLLGIIFILMWVFTRVVWVVSLNQEKF